MGNCFGGNTAQLHLESEILGPEEENRKILLLGTGEAGKTVNEELLKAIAPLIVANVVEGTILVLRYFEIYEQKKTPEYESLEEELTQFYKAAKVQVSIAPFLPKEIAHKLQKLHQDEAFQTVLAKGQEYHLPDSFAEFTNCLKEYPSWGGKGWIPSVENMLRVRVRTSGATTIDFAVKNTPYYLLDLGGQASERKKWITHLEGADALCFVASTGDYDQKSFEDNTGNRLRDSLDTWERYSNHKAFEDCIIFLFLNKIDILEDKFCKKQIPISYRDPRDAKYNPPKYNPQKSSDENLEIAAQWFKDIFTSYIRVERKPQLRMVTLTALEQTDVSSCINILHKELESAEHLA
eukprot:maker-scaffold_5-snap-gene-11.49-mRNA-1 protein AED:0.07 eAED:0.07 QI:86/0.8/1/1/1/1/6/90/350